MKVLSLAMAFVFAALAVAGSMEESSSNKLAEREDNDDSDDFEHRALTGTDMNRVIDVGRVARTRMNVIALLTRMDMNRVADWDGRE
ncbi:hypothetical protein N7510_002676 [Penicillium lagena]|uniref:uncharacterized protein n=1 Tax=Penicillium lagena TaxID=94218 RepID=UPI0025415B3A|nr:uncharacterized protein N7510_002676 [Penicillium lagena]KAJ5626367.1 hypothetical protein N7510_002676 [Penicillium lagena]